MESPSGEKDGRKRRVTVSKNRLFLNAMKGVEKEAPSRQTLVSLKVSLGPDPCSQNSEKAKLSQINEAQNKPLLSSSSSIEDSKANNSFKDVEKHSSNYKEHSNVLDNNKKSSHNVHSDRKENDIEKQQSFKSNTEVNKQEEESDNCIEFSEIKHKREVIDLSEGFKIRFENELVHSINSPTVPVDSASTSSISSLPSAVSQISSLSPPVQPVSSSSVTPITRLPPSSPAVSNLPSNIFSFPPPLSPLSSTPACGLPLYSSPPPVLPVCNLSPSSVLSPATENPADSNNILLAFEEDCFIPPPVLPSTVNANSSSMCLENKNFSQSNDLEATGNGILSLDDDDIYPSITDPEHIEAISNYILSVVKERSVNISSAIKVVRDINILFKNYFEGNMIDVYGSYFSDLAITTSDINLVVTAQISLRKSFMFEVYKVLAKELEKYHVHPYEEGSTTHQTKINFSHPETGVNCQLAYLGKYKENVFKMGKFLKLMVSTDSRVKTLIIATKIWAEYLAINEIEDGKLHPVGYALLVVHFLQHCENPILPLLYSTNVKDEKNSLSVGELWLGFLKYFSTFNWKQNVVTLTSKENVSKKSKHWENYWMAIEDPFSGKNIAETIVNIDIADYIKACFKSSYAYFCNPSDIVFHSSNNGDCQNNGEASSCKYEFSFQQCIVEQSDTFCERCEEIDDVCNECKKKIYVQPMASVPKMTDSFLSKIREALITIYNNYMLSEEEINERRLFVKELQDSVWKVYPEAEMNLFGSSTNGFGFKNSDLDICVTFKNKKINPAAVLKDIRHILRKDKHFNPVIAIFNAQIPIIKFHYKPKGWRGDISLDNTLAVHNSQLLYTYSLIDERCKILGCALKLLAKKALVAEVTEKALSSYSYLIMVIHFLQQINPPVLPVLQDNKFRKNNFSVDDFIENCNIWFCRDIDYIKEIFKSENVTNVEELWLDLLDYYCSFDNNQFITIRQKETQYIKEMKRSSRLFNIQDPFIETKNLGCVVSAKKAQETKSVFSRARQLFRTPIKELPSSIKDIEDYFFSTMSLTGRIHKEAHCNLCGKFGHEQKECKQSCFPVRRPNFRYFQQYNTFKSRNAVTNRKLVNRTVYSTYNIPNFYK